MSDHTPLLKFGDQVRIMQTKEMEDAGLANLIGTVAAKQRTPSHLVQVALDDDGATPNLVEVPADSLMRIQRPVFQFDERSMESIDALRARGIRVHEVSVGGKALYIPEDSHREER